jgi:ADP-heptose:LPS heptosyltransferase
LTDSTPKRILIVQVGKIGDMILTTPLFSGLKKIFPDYEIFVLTSKVNNEIALTNPNVSGTIVYKKNIFSVLKLIFTLRKLKFNFWIDTKDEYSSTSKTLLKFGNYDKSLGFNTKLDLFDVSLKEFVKSEHSVSYSLSPLYYFDNNFDAGKLKPEITIPLQTVNKYSEFFGKINKKKILVNVSAGSETRYWGTENWIEFIRQIDKNIEMILISDKKDKEFADSLIKNHISDNLTYVDADNIFEVAEVVRNCDVIVTPDTSIVHLASCFNKPIVAMFHNVEWVIKRYAPLSDVHRVILSKDRNSIADISVEEVLEKLKEIM